MKFLAVFAICFSVLANYLPVYAAAPATITCTNCGNTAYFSGSDERNSVKTGEHDVIALATNLPAKCYIYNADYVDTYMCRCGVPTRVVRSEKGVHSVVHI